MILIADSGSTKTEWISKHMSVTTKGINPVRDTKEEILEVITTELMPKLYHTDNSVLNEPITDIHFYGAGCIHPFSSSVKEAIETIFPQGKVHIYSDLLGAARALCKKQEGIACILGTGSNSCLCIGGEITQNISPLGYILGDEGSGAVLGKTLLSEMLKGKLQYLWPIFSKEYSLEQADIINKVYRQPQANKFLASLMPFIKMHTHIPEVKKMVIDEFTRFLQRNVIPYNRPDLEVNFVGGVATHFSKEISIACCECGLIMGNILARPAEEIYKYHICVI